MLLDQLLKLFYERKNARSDVSRSKLSYEALEERKFLAGDLQIDIGVVSSFATDNGSFEQHVVADGVLFFIEQDLSSFAKLVRADGTSSAEEHFQDNHTADIEFLAMGLGVERGCRQRQ